MTHPLQLSKDYIKIGDNAPVPVHAPLVEEGQGITRKRRKPVRHKTHNAHKQIGKCKSYFSSMLDTSPAKYRFMRFHGKGDLAAGYIYYINYFGRIEQESIDILAMLKSKRLQISYSLYLGYSKDSLAHYTKIRPAEKRGYWGKLCRMRKVIKGIDGFMESINIKERA